MLKRFCVDSWLLAVLLALMVFPTPLWAQPEGEDPQQEKASAPADGEILTRLANGLNVYIIRDSRFPLVSTRLFVATGSANERPEEAGISHVLEHMVFKGTDHRPKGKVAEEVESLGGYLNAATSYDRTWYVTDIPSAHWRTGIDVVKDMAFQASLAASELEPEKDVIVSELQGGEDSPQHKLYEDMAGAALANTPYGRPIIGFEPTIRAVTSQSLTAYRNFWYQPQNMSLLVAGDIEPNEVLAYVSQLFGDMKNTRELPALPSVDLTKAPADQVVSVRRGPWKKVYLGLAFPAPALSDLASVELDVLCYILGGDASSRFIHKYRYEKELCDAMSVDNMSLARAGLLSVSVELSEEKVAEFFTELMRDLSALRQGKLLSGAHLNDEIARAKLNISDSMDRAGETLQGLAAWKGTVQFLLGGAVGERNLRSKLSEVDLAMLNTQARRWFDPAQLRVRVLAPTEAKLPDFEKIMQEQFPADKADKQASQAYAEGPREEINLLNGCKLILLPDTHAPYLSLNLTRFGGNALLTPQEEGLSHLVAELLTDGADDLDAHAFETFLAQRALSFSVSSGRQSFTLEMDGPTRFSGDLCAVLNKVLTKPRFAAEDIERERRLMLSALQSREDQPLRYLFAKLRPFLYPGHVYGYDDLGKPELLARFDRKAVLAFWAKQASQPWILTVAGSFKRDQLLSFAQNLAANLSGGTSADVLKAPQLGTEKQLVLTLPGRTQAHLLKVFPTVPMQHEDAPALALLANILSGQSGLLFSSMRDDQGLGYTVTAFVRTLPRSGNFCFYIGTVPDKLEQAEQGFARVIEKLCTENLPQEQLDSGVNRLLGEYLRSSQSLAARSLEASKNALLGLPADFRSQLIAKAKGLTPEDLKACAQKYFALDNAYTIRLEP